MFKKTMALMAVAALIALTISCKKEEQPLTQAQQPPAQSIIMPAGEPQIVVPDMVKGVWSSVVLTIENKLTGDSKDVTVPVNSTYTIPGSNLKIEVGDFLPDFKMDGTVISSSSNELNNPAIRIKVQEGGEEIFKGWLYSKFPAIHPFQHETYTLLLKEGVKKG